MAAARDIYVCGDAAKMAKDVEAALLDVIIRAGHLDEEGAEEYLICWAKKNAISVMLID